MPRSRLLLGSTSALTLALMGLPPPARAQQAIQLDTIDVQAAAPRALSIPSSGVGYAASRAASTLKLPAPIQDVPLSVQVVPQEVIQDRQSLSVRQAVETVSGVESSNAIPGSQSFRIRGFSDGGGNLRDGFRETSNQQDVAGIDRIEVLKGPASVLFGGSLASGGIINIVTKAPTDVDFTRVGLLGGSFGLVRPSFDVNRDLSGDGSLQLRMDGAADRSDTFRRFGASRDAFVNPSLRWRPTDQDEVLLRAQYFHSDFSYGPYQSPIARQTLALPLSFSFTDPNQGESHKDAGRVSYEWTHKLDSGLKFRSGFNASVVDYALGTDRFARLSVLPIGATLSRVAQSGPQTIQDYDWQNELSGTFDTGPLRHDWLVGVESYWSLNDAIGNQVTLPNLNLLNPVYGVPIGPSRRVSDTSSGFDDHAGYVQDFVSLAPFWHLLIGGRYDATSASSVNRLTGVRIAGGADRFSPRVGLTFEPVPATALFFNWANSFVPTTATTASGAPLRPSAAQQYEVGVKQQAFDGRLQATLAAYQLTKTNVPTPDPANTLFSVASGEQRSRGIELDVAGEILPGWRGIANYAYTFAEVVRDNRLPEGDILAGVPRNAGSLWTTYEFQPDSVLHGFGIGSGIRAEGRREATLPNTFLLPGYVRLDAAAWYTFDVDRQPYRLQVNLQNMTDRRIFDTDGANTLRPQAPFNVLAE